MKRIVSFTLIVTIVLLLCSCSVTEPQKNNFADTATEEIKDDVWKITYLVDDFGQDTNTRVISTIHSVTGTFSNSVTTNSLLLVDCSYAPHEYDFFAFRLYEYGNLQVKNPYSHRAEYEVKIKTDLGFENTGTASFPAYGDTMGLDSAVSIVVNIYLESGQDVSFYIKEKDGMDEYRFTLESSNYPELYDSFK